jgi:hypothetical protein
MKTPRIYEIIRDRSGCIACTVYSGTRRRPLRHRVRHSPTGFECGYGGSGPADLALSILADLVGLKEADIYYQSFKFQFIAGVYLGIGQSHQIGECEIRTWLETQKREANNNAKASTLQS